MNKNSWRKPKQKRLQRHPSKPLIFAIPEHGMVWDDFEKACLQQALSRTLGNKTKAAKLLGISYKQFLYRLEKFGL